MVNMMQVQGTLIPAKSKMVTAEMADILSTVFSTHGFPGSVSDELEGKDTVIITTSVERVVENNLPANVTETGLQWEAVFNFTEALESALGAEPIKKLGLNGYLLVTVGSGAEPLHVLLTVDSKGVFYQQASLTTAE